jgi:serine/threonine protein kinase
MDVDNANLVLDVALHETYGVSALNQSSQRLKSYRRQWQVKDIPGLIAVTLARGITILNESANSSLDRIDSAKGLSSTVRIFDLRPGYAPTGSKYREGQTVVSKHLSKAVFENETRRFDAFVREIIMLSHPPIADHPNIVDLIAIGWEDYADYESGLIWPVSIIELAPYGSVQDFLLSGRFELGFQKLKALCGDVADGLAWLHACKIVHSDVKSENTIIVVSEEERDIPGFYFNAKLCDFGFALDMNALVELGLEKAWLDGYTPPWQPPEADDEIEVSLLPAVDVYCFGMAAARIFMKGGDPLNICVSEVSLLGELDRQTLVSQLHRLNAMPRQLTQRCLASNSYTERERTFLAELFQMATATQSTVRASMSQICEFLSVTPSISLYVPHNPTPCAIYSPSFYRNNASPLELEEEHTGIPSVSATDEYVF